MPSVVQRSGKETPTMAYFFVRPMLRYQLCFGHGFSIRVFCTQGKSLVLHSPTLADLIEV
jgi:hypothetical protein